LIKILILQTWPPTTETTTTTTSTSTTLLIQQRSESDSKPGGAGNLAGKEAGMDNKEVKTISYCN